MGGVKDNGNLTFVLGGARSGKTKLAMALTEGTAKERSVRPKYVATAPAAYAGAVADSGPDMEMAQRIETHRAERGAGWDTVEEPIEIAKVVEQGSANEVLLVDCLTLWMTNLMEQGQGDADIIERAEAFAKAAVKSQKTVIVVSNEVGHGVVPESSLGRRFRDLSGIVNQRVAASAKEVYFVTAGVAQKIKG